jgi:hypothetical protein
LASDQEALYKHLSTKLVVLFCNDSPRSTL